MRFFRVIYIYELLEAGLTSPRADACLILCNQRARESGVLSLTLC